MSPREAPLIRRILAAHGARSDLRIWRNESGVYWAGTPKGRTRGGHLILAGPVRVAAGLCKGSADLVGIREVATPNGVVGQFVALEVKTENVALAPHQRRWLELVERMGGLAGVVGSVDEVTEILGEPVRT